ncbi:hypothetical protein ATANTOWER_024281 [Ataeniobius toweri]|uniref:Uncharacterized protein n=1 Tax=Ataeniobius toweri TaxID=208326 RepID=A0ABU7C3N9_9TELE|nr:hypothetical protein [Ataeniobius toweri]
MMKYQILKRKSKKSKKKKEYDLKRCKERKCVEEMLHLILTVIESILTPLFLMVRELIATVLNSLELFFKVTKVKRDAAQDVYFFDVIVDLAEWLITQRTVDGFRDIEMYRLCN